MKRFVKKLSIVLLILIYSFSISTTTLAGIGQTASLSAGAGQVSGASAMPSTVPAAKPQFSDLPAQDGNEVFIKYLAQRDIIKGFPDGTFRPAKGLTRAEVVVLIARTLHLSDEPNDKHFTDVKASHWAANPIAAASKSGIITGYPDRTFRPDKILTRSEGISLLLRMSHEETPWIDLPRFDDVANNHWAAENISVALDSEMISPRDNKHFLPDAPFTRGDLARALSVLLTEEPTISQAALSNRLKVLKGSVQVSGYDNGANYKMNDSVEVKGGDRIKTGNGSSAELLFPDGTGILLQENTDLSVKELKGRSYIKRDASPGTAVEFLGLELKAGRIFGTLATPYHSSTEPTESEQKTAHITSAKVTAPKATKPKVTTPNAAKPKATTPKATASKATTPWWKNKSVKRVRVRVDMPWSVAAVRGTFWENEVIPGQYNKATVLFGEAELNSGTHTVQLGQGQRSEIRSPNSLPAAAAAMNETDKQEWVAVKEWAAVRAKDIQENQDGLVSVSSPVTVPGDNGSGSVLDTFNQALENLENPNLPEEQTGGSGGGGGGSPADTTPPVVVSISPVDGASQVSVDPTVVIDFSENISAGSAFNDILINGSEPTKSIVGNSLIITPAGPLQYNTNYTLNIPAGAVKDSTNNNFIGDDYTFTTEEFMAFQAAVQYTVGSGPKDVATGHFDLDTYLDMAVANAYSNSISILRGQGDGSFVAGTVYSLTLSPNAIASGDFNGDSITDLVTLNSGFLENVSLHLGDGSGGFLTPVNYDAGDSLSAMVAKDFNSDNICDLAVTDSTLGEVRILTGQSDGTFNVSSPYAAGTNTAAIAAEDFNNDTFPDLAVGNNDGIEGDVIILLNNGDGTFSNASPTIVNMQIRGLAAGNFDGGSDYDIAVLHFTHDNNVSVLLGQGDGNTVAGSVYSPGQYPGGIAVTDINSDGRHDIAVITGFTGQEIVVLAGNGDGTFQGPFYLTGVSSPINIKAVDLDGDSRQDLIVVNQISDSISVLLNNT